MGMGRCVGTPETVVLTSAAEFGATVTEADAFESPATFEATAASSDAAD